MNRDKSAVNPLQPPVNPAQASRYHGHASFYLALFARILATDFVQILVQMLVPYYFQ